jgi:hypothetical protein
VSSNRNFKIPSVVSTLKSPDLTVFRMIHKNKSWNYLENVIVFWGENFLGSKCFKWGVHLSWFLLSCNLLFKPIKNPSPPLLTMYWKILNFIFPLGYTHVFLFTYVWGQQCMDQVQGITFSFFKVELYKPLYCERLNNNNKNMSSTFRSWRLEEG